MPPRPSIPVPTRPWTCPSCRHYSITLPTQAVGPEHPRYIPFPTPPQQTSTPRKWMKGILPVPRSVFARKRGKDVASDDLIERTTPDAFTETAFPEGSREAWRTKVAEQRKRNLREGLRELKERQVRSTANTRARRGRVQRERDEMVARPEREDERLTAPSHGLDLKELFGPLQDPDRAQRLATKKANQAAFLAARSAARASSLHTLYSHARNFITTPAQLDASIEKAFGSNEEPTKFGPDHGNPESVWNLGAPLSVQDMLNRANGGRRRGGGALESAGQTVEINRERVKRIAEALTGGVMDEKERGSRGGAFE
ncbi:hypothetical protein B0A48_13328 [Cryoendolithus antarcticus]|uniref:Uncharacterized protein n=1 Tax=Cryoendolithus antarcticus TaxID=1507870 RepID=A0A1V8SPJ5_9PEZI|nr:hypothetical protein B0A48_13328 [Cryoendolithus antarcticus]